MPVELGVPVQMAQPAAIQDHPRMRGGEQPGETPLPRSHEEGSPEKRQEEGSKVDNVEMEDPPPEDTQENLEEMPNLKETQDEILENEQFMSEARN